MRGAVILAGGFSTRFEDGDKAVAPVAGTPMIRRVFATVAPVVDEVVVNARREQRRAIEDALDGVGRSYRFAFDAVPDRGPLAGMATGLSAVSATNTLVIACDMPFVQRDFVESLFELASTAEAAIPVERGPDANWRQPLQAVYETEAAQRAFREALEAGVESPATAVERLASETVIVSTDVEGTAGWTLKNVNDCEDRREADRYFSRTDADRSNRAVFRSSNGVR